MRIISGLVSARKCQRPACIPKSRPRGRKAAGLRYERELARALTGASHGQWFEFEDVNGPGYCQPDLILEVDSAILVLEAKYTWTRQGHVQIDKLYKPVLGVESKKPVFGIVVCKVLTQETPRDWVCRSLTEAVARACCGLPTVLHWVGAGLEPLRTAPRPVPLAESIPLA